MARLEFTYRIEGEVRFMADSESEAEERINRVRERLEQTINNVEIELVDQSEIALEPED